jgi:hypothetical protein
MTSAILLVASPDDYLLEEALGETLQSVRTEFGDVEPEIMPEEMTPEALSVELCSPSLFAPQRVLVVPEIGRWLGAAAGSRGEKEDPDLTPLIRALGEGLADGIALVMGACCGSKPKGELVDAIVESGSFQWQPVPKPPKPWEDTVLSKEQEAVLRKLLARVAGEVRFTPEAIDLLLERLGFAPRLLVQEGRKLAAANVEGVVDEGLVQALCFPRERSLDVVWEAVYERRAKPILDIMASAEAGIPVRDRQGRNVTGQSAPYILFGQVSSILQKLLYLRRLAAQHGLLEEMAPERTSDRSWYPRKFKNGFGPELVELIEDDSPSPMRKRGGKAPTLFALGNPFKGAGRYTDQDLVNALAELGRVETALRGDMPGEALSVWLTSFLH